MTPRVYVDDDIDCRITVRNIGDGPATEVEITTPLPPGTEFLSAYWDAQESAQTAPLEAYVADDIIHILLGDLLSGDERT